MPELILVDGSYFLHRAYHASHKANFTAPDGRPSGVVKFMFNMLRPMMRNNTCPVVVTYDHSGKNFRHDMYDGYKANRGDTNQEIVDQFPAVKAMTKALGFKVIIKDGYEADDVLGTLAREATEAEMDTLIHTGDKDIAQFISPFVKLFDPRAGKSTDADSLYTEKGIRPEQVVAYLALCGDKVDCIPGLEGCGPGTAVKWLQEYGTIKGIVKNKDKIKGKIGERLRDNIPILKLSYKLAKGEVHVPLKTSATSVKRGKVNKRKLEAILDDYGVKSMGLVHKAPWA
jgi:DNA polymerase-1